MAGPEDKRFYPKGSEQWINIIATQPMADPDVAAALVASYLSEQSKKEIVQKKNAGNGNKPT